MSQSPWLQLCDPTPDPRTCTTDNRYCVLSGSRYRAKTEAPQEIVRRWEQLGAPEPLRYWPQFSSCSMWSAGKPSVSCLTEAGMGCCGSRSGVGRGGQGLGEGEEEDGQEGHKHGSQRGRRELIDKVNTPSSTGRGDRGRPSTDNEDDDTDLIGLREVEPTVHTASTVPNAARAQGVSALSRTSEVPPPPPPPPTTTTTTTTTTTSKSPAGKPTAKQQMMVEEEEEEEEGEDIQERHGAVKGAKESVSSSKTPPSSPKVTLPAPPPAADHLAFKRGEGLDRSGGGLTASQNSLSVSESAQYGHHHNSPAEDPVRAFIVALIVGVVVFKHDRKGRAKLRELYTADDGNSFSWREPSNGGKGGHGQHERSKSGTGVFERDRAHYSFDDVLEVRRGTMLDPSSTKHETGTAVLRASCDPSDFHKSFSLILHDRSVDLTCHSMEQMTFLIKGFGAIVAQRRKKRLQH